MQWVLVGKIRKYASSKKSASDKLDITAPKKSTSAN